MRLKTRSSLLIARFRCFGCYVQPYNPPPAHTGSPAATGAAAAATAAVRPATRVRAATARAAAAAGRPAGAAARPASRAADARSPAGRSTTTSTSTSRAATCRRSTSSTTTSRPTAAGTTTRPTAGCSRRRRRVPAVLERPLGVHRLRLHLGVGRSVRLGDRSLRPLGVGQSLGLASRHDLGPGLGALARRATATSAGRPSGYTDDAYVPDAAWRFVGAAQPVRARRSAASTSRANVGTYLRAAVPVRRYARHGNQTWVAGPDDDWLRRYRVEPRRERLRSRPDSAATTISSGARRSAARTSTSATGTRAGGKTTSSGAICGAPAARGRGAPAAGARSSAA